MTVSMDDATYEEKTQTVGSGYSYAFKQYTHHKNGKSSGKYSNLEGDPDSIYFNKYFCLLARHYESKICISLHDAKTDRRVGYSETSSVSSTTLAEVPPCFHLFICVQVASSSE